MALLEELREAVVDGQAKLAVAKVTEGVEEGIAADVLLQEGLIAVMKEAGQLFEEGEIFVPEMLVAARAMNATLSCSSPAWPTRVTRHAQSGQWPLAQSRVTCTTSARTSWPCARGLRFQRRRPRHRCRS